MKRSKEQDIYKIAFFLSLAIHVFFVTGAEAALILGKRVNPATTFTVFTSLPDDHLQSVESAGLKELKKESSVEQTIKEPIEAVKLNPAIEMKRRSMLEKIKKFKTRQNRMDQRINSIKKEIVQRQIQLLRSVGSSVYDADKIPADMRTSVLPDYLKRMRSRISSRWLVFLDHVECESCAAIMEYRIDQDGRISHLQLIHSSHDDRFDTSCIKAIIESNSLPALPFHFNEEIKGQYLTVSLAFYFERKKPKLSFVSLFN